MKNVYVDVHVLQTVPPSNLNRDDAGSPKQAVFGGARRARVSSQAWKRATRKHFAATAAPGADPATRTDRLAVLLARGFVGRGVDAGSAKRVSELLVRQAGISIDEAATKKKKNPSSYLPTSYLLFVGRDQVERVVEQARARLPENPSDLSDPELSQLLADVSVEGELGAGHPVEVALFGRMVADIVSLNVDAAVQVAHAISTHVVDTEFDYFTAVDDEKDRLVGDDLGAGMIGTVEFNSATLYRYATVGVQQLLDNLEGSEGVAIGAARRFVEGFVRSMPTGHQTSFAHRTLPDAVVVVLREDQPVNLVSAFERPVKAAPGYAAASLVALAKEYGEIGRQWGGAPAVVGAAYAVRGLDGDQAGAVTSAFGDPRSFSDVLDLTESSIRERLAERRP